MFNILKNIFSIIDSKSKYKGIALVIAFVIGGFAEILGLGLILPAFYLILNLEDTNNPYVLKYLTYFGDIEYQNIIIITLLFLICAFFIKNIYLTILVKIQMNYAFNTQVNISSMLYKKYLFDSFEKHNSSNSNQILNLIVLECGSLSAILNSAIVVLTESVYSLLIASVLFLIQPLGTFVILMLFTVLIISFQKFSKVKTETYANVRLKTDVQRTQVVKESLLGIKEIKISNVEIFFYEFYKKLSIISSNANAKQNTLQQVPRFWTEFISIFCLTILVFILILQGLDSEQIFLLISIYGVAAIRFIPSSNRILASFQTLNYMKPVISTIKKEIFEKNSLNEIHSNQTIVFERKIEIKELGFYYNKNVPLFNNLNLKFDSGDSLGIIGPSGVGKTTFINILLGLIKPKNGEVVIDDKILNKHNTSSFHGQIGYVPQKPVILNDTIKNNIALGLSDNEIDNIKVEKALKRAMLIDFVDTLPKKTRTVVGDNGAFLSGGQCQRLAIARALYRDPKILIFDESTSSLDLSTEKEILSTIKSFKRDKTIIIISHRPQSLEFCDKVFDLEKEILEANNN